jgi:uncharacterized membrane protein
MSLASHVRHGFVLPSLLIGAALWLALWLVGLPAMDALMLGWCAHTLFHSAWCWRELGRATPERMRERSRTLAEGRWTILGLALGAAAVSLGVVVGELVMQQEASAAERVLAVATIILSWCHVHMLFAQQYAHEYWTRDEGLNFPGGDGTPEFSEFCYVALTVGTTAQVSDTSTSTPRMRRLVMLHAALSFAFNAVILASSVNVLAGLARR